MSLHREQASHGQTLREALEEVQMRNTRKLVRTAPGVPQVAEVMTYREGPRSGRAKQRGKAETEISGRSYRQRTEITGVNPMDMPGAAAEIAQMNERMCRAVYRNTDGLSSVAMHRAREPGQRTEITGVNPMRLPGAGAEIVQMHDRMRKIVQTEMSGARAANVHRPHRYWQRTAITGQDPLNVPQGGTHGTESDEPSDPRGNVDQISAVSGPASGSANSTRMAEENGESEFYRSLDGAERAIILGSSSISELVNELRTRLGLRTSTDIFESSQRKNGERRVREWKSRKRTWPLTNTRASRGGSEERPHKRAPAVTERSESPEENTGDGEEVAATMRALDEEFNEKEHQSHEPCGASLFPTRERRRLCGSSIAPFMKRRNYRLELVPSAIVSSRSSS